MNSHITGDRLKVNAANLAEHCKALDELLDRKSELRRMVRRFMVEIHAPTIDLFCVVANDGDIERLAFVLGGKINGFEAAA